MARLPAAIVLALVVYLASAAPASGASGWVWPLRGEVITAYRNGDDPYAAGQHRGIDIAGAVGAPVVAARAGTVRFAGVVGDSGLTVGVRTADGRYDTSYLHLSSVSVRKGERVAAGQRLGAVGTSGRRSVARPHLHFGVRDAGSRHAYHDPMDFLPPPVRPRPAPRRPPVPVGAPARPSPAPVAVPRRQPRAIPRRAPRALPRRAPRAVPALRPAPELHGVPAPVRPLVARVRHGAPEAGPSAAPAPVRAPQLRPAPHAADRGAPGPDLGWALACLGLLLAAALVGTRRDPRQSAGGVSSRVGALLRPLTGRG